MSVSALTHGLFGTAVSLLTRPSAQLAGFSVDPAKSDTSQKASAAKPGSPLHHDTQAALLALQQQQHRAGAFARGLDQVISGQG